MSSLLLYPEARAALAAAHGAGRLRGPGAATAGRRLDRLFRKLAVIDVDRSLARDAGRLAERHGLRGYDAVHLASAQAAETTLDDVVLVTWDDDLARAARRDGLPVAGGP